MCRALVYHSAGLHPGTGSSKDIKAVADDKQMLVDSRACNLTLTRLSSNKINQPEVTGKIHTEPNDHDQSKVFRTLNFLSISSNYELTSS
jgi:hypothetical protein